MEGSGFPRRDRARQTDAAAQVRLAQAKQKGRRSALLHRIEFLLEQANERTATDLGQFRKAKLDNFFFYFNDLLDYLVHGALFLPYKSSSIELELKVPTFWPISELSGM
jgi:hypothetical protein